MEMLGEKAPDLAPIGLNGLAVDAGNTEAFQGDSLAEQHAEDIMIGNDQKLGWVGEWFVFGEPTRIGVTMRADDRQVANLPIEPARQAADRRLDRKQAIVIQQHETLPSAMDEFS